MRFQSAVRLHGKTATGIEVPDDVVAGLGAGKRHAVSVTIRGYTYRTTVAPMGGRFLIPVSAEIRKNAGIAAGDDVDVDIEPDTAPREVTVPSDLAAALAADADARRTFDGLSYSRQQRYVLSVEDARTPETRKRRVDRAVTELRAL
jgi:bifunctional DNA-binding transcriptional regulator/antitoxin component of YhaV-PrlF toxin-antitoxin module